MAYRCLPTADIENRIFPFLSGKKYLCNGLLQKGSGRSMQIQCKQS